MSKKILIAMFKHETNVFCPLPADRKAFENRELTFGEDVFSFYRGVESEVGAFLDVLGDDPFFELTPTIAFNAPPSAHVSAEVYDLAVHEITRAIREKGPFDGILLSLHGAMVAEGHCDGEGDLIEIIRYLVGPEIPIIASLDLHANITAKMARCADALVPYEGYPHTDTYATGIRAAELMRDTMKGLLRPTMGYRRIPYLLPMYPTSRPEIARYHDMGRDWAKQPGVAVARVTHGFFPADIAISWLRQSGPAAAASVSTSPTSIRFSTRRKPSNPAPSSLPTPPTTPAAVPSAIPPTSSAAFWSGRSPVPPLPPSSTPPASMPANRPVSAIPSP